MSNFIQQSRAGRNPWYAFPLLLLGSLVVVVVLNQFVNRLIVPLVKARGWQDAGDYLIYVMILLVFGGLTLVLRTVQRCVHGRSLGSLVNAQPTRFRWSLYGRGVALWGALLLISTVGMDRAAFDAFLTDFSGLPFVLTFVLAGCGLFVQTLWEELLFRGYLLQGLGRRFASLLIVNLLISSLFALAHFGYGLENLLHSFLFSVVVTLLTLHDRGIERAAGAHFANNFLLLLFFADVSDVADSTFSWVVDWVEMAWYVGSLAVLIVVSQRGNRGERTSERPVVAQPVVEG